MNKVTRHGTGSLRDSVSWSSGTEVTAESENANIIYGWGQACTTWFYQVTVQYRRQRRK